MIRHNQTRFREGGLAMLPESESDFFLWAADPDGVLVGVYGEDDEGFSQCIGFAGVTRMRVGQMTENGAGVWYAVDKAHEGKGIATFAAQEALRQFRQQFPSVEQAYIHCQKNNPRSRALAARLGMQRDLVADYYRATGARTGMTLTAYSSSVHQVVNALPMRAAKSSSCSLE